MQIQDIAFSYYELVGQASLRAGGQAKSRVGALLRVETEVGYGYADCHPWLELGDLKLEAQLDALGTGNYTPLLERSLEFAFQDADARAAQKNLFENLQVPRSHRLIPDLEEDLLIKELARASDGGYSAIKLKVGPSDGNRLKFIVENLPRNLRLRIDCNGCFASAEAALAVLGVIPPTALEFIEDPCKDRDWSTLIEAGYVCAQDRIECRLAGVLVVKPAVDELLGFSFSSERKIAVSSYLDHPVGQSFAALTAALLMRRSNLSLVDAGLHSHQVYELNAYSERLGIGSQWQSVEGFGIGFDDLLVREKWQPL